MEDKESPADWRSPDVARLLRLATYASVGVAVTLVLVKLAAYSYTDSVSLLSSLIDSLLDAAASLINLIAVRQALVPPDREHRFGHGKAEPLAALGQAAFITGSAVFLLVEAVHRMVERSEVTHGEIGIAVMVFSIVLTFALTRLQAYVVRKTGSLAIQADSLHYLADLMVNGAVIVALILVTQLGWWVVDPLFGIAIAAYIVYSAWTIARGALDMLMDRELPDDERKKIAGIARSHPEVRSTHDLRTRASGPMVFIQLHIELDGEMDLLRAHEIADEVEENIKAAYPGAEVIIHQDPYGVEEERASFA